MIVKTYQGYYIEVARKGYKFPLYVHYTYGGRVYWTTDYTHARRYTRKTAERLDKEISEDIARGTFEWR